MKSLDQKVLPPRGSLLELQKLQDLPSFGRRMLVQLVSRFSGRAIITYFFLGSAIPGQPEQGYIPHKGKLSPKENILYVSYANTAGPSGGTEGSVFSFNITSGVWTDITPEKDGFGFGGLSVDLQKPGTLIVGALNKWWPDTRKSSRENHK